MNPSLIDLRSDTLTLPTAGMRRAMANAVVGDDVFGEDPTINALQKRMAELFNKEAALFVSSGTMANQLAIKCHTRPGDEVVCEIDCHPFNYEGGGPAMLSGVQMHPLVGKRGVITVDQLTTCLRPSDDHYPRLSLVLLENTHNRAGGAIFPLAEMKRIHRFTRQNKLALHLDGARLWNAHVATGISLAEYGQYCDSVTVCLSKGLGAPVGSVLMGTREFIAQAHRYRKVWGGGMRQAGILAAAGLYALDHHIERLAIDHENAKKMALAFAKFAPVRVDLEATQTNMVIADFVETGLKAATVVKELKKNGLVCLDISPSRIRLVTHLNISPAANRKAIAIIDRTLAELLG